MITLEDVKECLTNYFGLQDLSDNLIQSIINDYTEDFCNDCNLDEYPDKALRHGVRQVAYSYLINRLLAGKLDMDSLDLSAFATSIKDGDTQTSFDASQSPVKLLLDYASVQNAKDDEVRSMFRDWSY